MDRRRFLTGALALGGAAALSGCDQIAGAKAGQAALQAGEDANMFVQRLLLTPQKMAHEFAENELSAHFKPNGSTDPQDGEYKKLVAETFASYKLKVGGLVQQPFEISVEEIRALTARTQITRHDCVEGWSAIGKWTGPQLSQLLQRAQLKPQARYVVFHCFDSMDEGGLTANDESSRYYESVDLVDAFHPQTIVAFELNGKPLEVAHGAPLRLRVERQLGYKSAKYLKSIEVVESFADLNGGRGGYWPDQGYDWYAGI
jgi:DMSO/TMAO reductase YedYZ molybdopterin-dependent catalytic subunit